MMNPGTTTRRFIWVTAFFSGAAGLIYEVLWFREFALRLGNTAEASAWVLGVLFGGLALGNLLGGRWSKSHRHPLRAYAVLEIFMAVCGLGLLVLKSRAGGIGLPSLFTLLTGVAVLMGGTLPLLLHALPGSSQKLRGDAPLLYGLNTVGGMIGVCGAGLFLPAFLGVNGSFMIAVSLNVLLSVAAFAVSLFAPTVERDAKPEQLSFSPQKMNHRARPFWLVAALSGMGALGLEVLWTRMFSLVFQNSVYSFSFILMTILGALALAAAWAGALVKKGADPLRLLWRCMAVSAVSIPLGAWLFIQTSGLKSLFVETGPLAYILKVAVLTAGLLFPTMIAAGMMLPLCWAITEERGEEAGWSLGRLLTFNTVGGVAGSFCAGFVLLPKLGLWAGLGVMAFWYGLGALYLAHLFPEDERRRTRLCFSSAALLLPAVLVFPFFATQYLKPGESLLYLDQGAEAQVSVIQTRQGGRVLKVNNTYSLGSSKAEIVERRMGHIPLLLHPEPKSAVFVGLATGITASAIFDHPVEKATLIELLPEVVKGVAWFEAENRGLLHDPRTEVVIADGRIALPQAKTPFDVIISDLFVPWHAGATALYSLEHYQAASERLSPYGIYAQWLPLYQMSPEEFRVIGKTFHAVFPHVTLWRANFSTTSPIVALIGTKQPLETDRVRLLERLSHIEAIPGKMDPYLATPDDFMLLFGGGAKSLPQVFEDAPLNTDDYPYIEYHAPLSHITRNRLTGGGLAKLYTRLAQDNNKWQNHALAGARLYEADIALRQKNSIERIAALKEASTLVEGSLRLAKIGRALEISGLLGQKTPIKN
ncbi:MAG: spermidine synthase [Nitrospiria bacterium]